MTKCAFPGCEKERRTRKTHKWCHGHIAQYYRYGKDESKMTPLWKRGVGRARTVSDDELNAIVKMYRTGMWTQPELAEKFGVKVGTLAKYLIGVKPKKKHKPKPAAKRETAKKKQEKINLDDPKALAERLDDEDKDTEAKMSDREGRQARSMYRTGMWTQPELAEKFGVGIKTLRKHVVVEKTSEAEDAYDEDEELHWDVNKQVPWVHLRRKRKAA